jgi:hypothetical protein
MKLYYLVPTGTSPKLDIFEIQYNTINRVWLKKKYFKGSKVRQKIIRDKSKIYKNSQNVIKTKKLLNYLHENRWKNA